MLGGRCPPLPVLLQLRAREQQPVTLPNTIFSRISSCAPWSCGYRGYPHWCFGYGRSRSGGTIPDPHSEFYHLGYSKNATIGCRADPFGLQVSPRAIRSTVRRRLCPEGDPLPLFRISVDSKGS